MDQNLITIIKYLGHDLNNLYLQKVINKHLINLIERFKFFFHQNNIYLSDIHEIQNQFLLQVKFSNNLKNRWLALPVDEALVTILKIQHHLLHLG